MSITLETLKQYVLPAESYKTRNNFSDLALNTLGVLGNLAMQVKRILPKEDSSILGFVKCLSFISAGNNFYSAGVNIEQSADIKDMAGQRANQVKQVRSGMQFLSGAFYFSSLGLSLSSSIASFKTVITASKILSKTTTILSNSAVFLMLLLISMKLHEQRGFQLELDKKLSELQHVSPQEKEEAIAAFLQEQISVSEPLQKQLKTKLRERYAKKSIEDITNSKKSYYKNIDAYVAHRFLREISKKEAVKAARMKRVTNRNCLERLEPLKKKITDPNITIDTAILAEIQAVAYKNMMFNYLAIGFASIGLLGLAISFIPGTAFVTLSTILGLASTVAFSALGVYDLVQSLQNNKEGLYDRLVLIATGCIGIITSTALYALTENILVKCAAILLAVVWLSLLYYVSSRLENQPKSA
ncbi:hypothetical protein RHABOEDO_001218 [Candidatus Rhabdochlamydia oedothoracis]|uniref:Uncharacterized protein n=1 Tax=Candidatus Rhabdochlamydia oedothoracis TaxID=2720720 RepID=A0ABX8V5W6_9BACT|nr:MULTISPECIES: hypothetical protein [Rhabdochlamydia]KAG6559289.1 hypothetical protein RHOW815_000702 [Candidatus Rhabdochlamydia sp. W815]QYF48972.1 hypothetical protein RHABOEDO_001218 [Candidatus Rhabdochlamydia oedothoracis]